MKIKNNITDSYPSIIHSPDVSDLWHRIVREFRKNIVVSRIDPRVTIITWNNLKTSILEECLSLRKIEYQVLGKDIEIWNNFKKFSLNIEALKQITTEYVIGLDSHDVLFLGEPESIVNTFQDMGCDMLFNSETYFYPNWTPVYFKECKDFEDRISSGNKYRYLNSGAWIGKSEFSRKFFEYCSHIRLWEMFDCTGHLKVFNCDQSVVHGALKYFYPRVQLDYGCRIFNNIALIDPKEIEIKT